MADIFKFKQFEVNQQNCAMKVNTDGVLLGALAEATAPGSILDIGTGTGVIALMLAQRFTEASIDAVEIDELAALTARSNFKNSGFEPRMEVFALGFEEYFGQKPGKRYDLIVSNPPFFLNSLGSPAEKKNLARHTDGAFFEKLIKSVAYHLTDGGVCALVLPGATSLFVKGLLFASNLCLQKNIKVRSFSHSDPHREIITFGATPGITIEDDLVIYSSPKTYSDSYQTVLKDFLTIF